MIFFITGFTASGKSTYGLELARELDIAFVDLDQYIQESFEVHINDLFEQGKEEDFRNMESQALQRLIKTQRDDVLIALGGGTMCTSYHADLILRSGICIYLHQETNEILTQLDYLIENRPQYTGLSRSEATEKVLKLHALRLPFYRRSQLETRINSGFSAKKLANTLKLLTNRSHSL